MVLDCASASKERGCNDKERKRGMTNSSALDPETLARIAAQLNPQLACHDPAKAIQLARNLLIAANPELAEQAEEMRLQEESERADILFPVNERISVAEAFKASPGHYKT